MEQNYIPSMRMSQPSSTSGSSAYAQTISSSPALYQTRTVPEASASSRRHSELPSSSLDQSYGQSYRRISNPYDSSSSSQYSMATSQTIPSISGLTHSPLPSPHMGASSGAGGAPHYNTSMSRSVFDNHCRPLRNTKRNPDPHDCTTQPCTHNHTQHHQHRHSFTRRRRA